MSKVPLRLLQILVALALPLALLLGNIQLLMHPRFVRVEYSRAGFPADTAIPPGGYTLSRAERTALADAALRSILGAEGMRALEEARFRESGMPAFSTREIGHMQDVRWLFERARVVFWAASAVLLGGGALLLIWSRRSGRGRYALTQPLLVSVVATFSLALALGLYILVGFGSFFTRFHRLFFEGDTWLFHQDDTLIRLFPTTFWFDATALIAGLTIVELLIVGAAAWWSGRRAP
jgi:integral membrane protein (TIGR01906 family)